MKTDNRNFRYLILLAIVGLLSLNIVKAVSNDDILQRKNGVMEYRTPAQYKADLGLGNIDNTADTAKPVSTAQQTALDLKANIASPTFTGTVGGITKSMVGLGSVDNTADTGKPVSTAQQTALDLKANLASPTFTGTIAGITKTMVGLGNVDNTSDASKPISTLQQAALDLKAALASPTFTGTVTVPDASFSLAKLANMATGSLYYRKTAGSGAPEINTLATLKTDLVLVKGDVGLGSVDNTSDAGKPVSTAQQTALDLKANLASPTFTGTVVVPDASFVLAKLANMATASLYYRKTAGSGAPEVNTLATLKTDLTLVKGDVGLGSVDNTSDAGKPVSTAQQTALNLKGNITSQTFVTPNIGVASGTSLAATGLITSSSASAGIGYATGAGGAVTQATNRTTGVTLNTISGAITTNNTSLAAGAEAAFTVTDSAVAVGDVIVLSARSGQTAGTSVPLVTAVAAGSFQITLSNLHASTADTGAMIINFVVIKAVSA